MEHGGIHQTHGGIMIFEPKHSVALDFD